MKRFGIDLGSASIGWVITENGEILKKGVVRFETGMMKGQTGGYVSPTKNRREARSKRNLIRARKYRKWTLLETLIANNCIPLDYEELEIWNKYKKGRIRRFPESEIFNKWLACDFTYQDGVNYRNPYELRVQALSNKVSKHEFGRALYHLVQRRGYKDIGNTDNETEKQISRRGESGFQDALNANDKLISKALLNEFINKNKRARNHYPYREEYKYELEELCKAQGYDISTVSDKDGAYTDAFVKKLWKAIIWQRDLKSQKGNIGKCTLEPNKLRCPISHPIYEIFRAWSFINTIMYFDENNEKQSISQENKRKLFEFFLKKDKNFKFEDIRVFLDKQFKSPKRYNYPIDKNEKNKNKKYTDGTYDTSVSGMPICNGLIDVFGDKARLALENIEQQNISQKDKCGGFGNCHRLIGKYSIIDLWHVLFAFDKKTSKERNFLEIFAKEKLNIVDAKQVERFVNIKDKFSQGYADLSVNAMSRIIPFLKDGYLYNEAVVLAKIPELIGINWESQKSQILFATEQANRAYEWNKAIVSITNNLIDKFKGLRNDHKFAFRDFEYILDEDDKNDIAKACEGFFGKLSWEKKTNKSEIIKSVTLKYQEFFNDESRTYRKVETLTDILSRKFKDLGVKVDSNRLYHHSNNQNIYLRKCKIDSETEKPILPKAVNNFGVKVDILPSVQIDSIKNPMFNKSMTILRKLINNFIKEGLVDIETEIIIEIARELNDNNKRIAIERYQNERKRNRDKYREFLSEFNRQKSLNLNIEESIPTFELWTEQIFDETIDDSNTKTTNKNRIEILKEKDAIKRYELWSEQRGQCIYTGKMISLSKLFSNEIDIEHTVPRSLLPDDTLANQTVCYASYNRNKKRNQIPTQCLNYYSDNDGWGTRIEPRLEKWIKIRERYKDEYTKRLKANGNEDEIVKNKRIQDRHYNKMHYDYWKDKIERFEALEVNDNWARRQLTDTQMASKYAREFLKTYFMKVAVQKGSVTAAFRKILGFQDADEIKSRNKHTHHAIDALVLTLIPNNSSHRERILKEYFDAIENNDKDRIKEIQYHEVPNSFNVQKYINDIENTTLIYNYENDTTTKQTYKIVRKRGKRQYLKDKNGKFILDNNGKKILLIAQGDTVRSELYAQTYLGKIKDVERDDYEKIIVVKKLGINLPIKGFPKREGKEWKYKSGNDEFCFVKRENIDKVKSSDSSISSIVDPVIRELVNIQKNEPEIKDYQGNIIRHVRIRTSSGKEVKNRVNYLSHHEYKNKFYSEAGSIPYAILLQQPTNHGVKREMIPIASYEVAKMRKKAGRFDLEQYIYDNQAEYINWNKQLLKVGQKVFVLKDDSDFENRHKIDFMKNRLYVITQFSDGSIWLKYHLSTLSKDEVKNSVSLEKDKLLCQIEKEHNIPPVCEDASIGDLRKRNQDYENRRYRFDTIDKSFRLKRLSQIIGIDKTVAIKKELDKYKAIPSSIEIEGETHLLKMSKEKWNFLIEGEDFTMTKDGSIAFYK